MKKIESTSVQYLIIQIVGIAVAGMIIWPLFDMFWCAVISHTEFVYTVSEYVLEPIVFGCIAGTVFWVIERKRARK